MLRNVLPSFRKQRPDTTRPLEAGGGCGTPSKQLVWLEEAWCVTFLKHLWQVREARGPLRFTAMVAAGASRSSPPSGSPPSPHEDAALGGRLDRRWTSRENKETHR